jgi:two-component SAPR family response regulator
MTTSSLEKAIKLLGDTANEIESMGSDDLKKLIVDSQKYVQEIQVQEEEDEKLKSAKELVSDLRGGYTEAKKYSKAKITVAVCRLNNVGG